MTNPADGGGVTVTARQLAAVGLAALMLWGGLGAIIGATAPLASSHAPDSGLGSSVATTTGSPPATLLGALTVSSAPVPASAPGLACCGANRDAVHTESTLPTGTVRGSSASPDASPPLARSGPEGDVGGPFPSATRYSVTFNATGLGNEQWGVTLGGTHQTLNGSGVITFQEPNGSLSYRIDDVAGWHQTTYAYSGTVNVRGGPINWLLLFAQVTYPLSFTASGLPIGTAWTVTINGTLSANVTPGAIVARVPNGTVTYRVGDVPGWHQSTLAYAGNLSVNGTAVVEPTLRFAPVTYGVAFSESGLPGGLVWAVTLNGTTYSASAPASVVASLPNGTFTYAIGSIAGWTQSTLPSNGHGTISGSAATEPTLQFAPFTYAVTFNATGLGNEQWGVTLGGTHQTLNGSGVITFQEPNGSLSYRIDDVAGWHQTTYAYSGTVNVTGGPVNWLLLFAQVTYPLSFTASGLPIGTGWAVTINGTLSANRTPGAILAMVPNGTVTYLIGDVPGWHQSTLAYAGNLSVNGTAVVEPTLQFAPVTYGVTFSESGLPGGLVWSVTLNGTTHSASAPASVVASLPNGTFTYAIGPIAGWTQSTLPSDGQGTISGSALTEPTLAFEEAFSVTYNATGLPAGVVWGVSINGSAPGFNESDRPIVLELANGTYPYEILDVPGWHQTTLPYAGTVTVNGTQLTEPTLQFVQFTYALTFSASGLAGGVTWGVTVNGTHLTQVGPGRIIFAEPNGTFAYGIDDAGGWHQTTLPYAGTGRVSGAPVNEPTLLFDPVDYLVTFTESGLPSGTSWSVLIDCANCSAINGTASELFLSTTNGTYQFIVSSAVGYRAIPANGTIAVDGGAVAQPIRFVAPRSSATFTETGLAAGASWSVALHGSSQAAIAPGAIVFSNLSSGTYPFVISAPGYTATPPSGSLQVNQTGAPVQQAIHFRAIAPGSYTVLFEETGLPRGAGVVWSVTFDRISQHSTPDGLTIEFLQTNGTYSFEVGPLPGYRSTPSSGSIRVSGTNVTELVQFVLIPPPPEFTVTFTETGLPSGANWSVRVHGGTDFALAPGFITAQLPNGTYPYTFEPAGPYTPWPEASGNVSVAGSAAGVTAAYELTFAVLFVESGLPNGTLWTVVVVPAAAGGGPAATDPSWAAGSTGPNATLFLANGSYGFTISAEGYTPLTGGLTVAGTSITQPAAFPSGSGSASAAPWWLWVAIFVPAVTAVLLGLLAVTRRRPPGNRPR